MSRWRVAGYCALVAALLGILAGVLDRSSPLSFGHDLISSYTAGRLLLEGHGASLYDAAACESGGRAVMADANLTGNPYHIRWLYPASFAPLFVPLALLPYRWAMLVWMSGNAAVFGAALATIIRSLPPIRRSRWMFIAVVVTSCPFLLAFQHQQNTFLSLGILSAVVSAWRADRRLLAGLLAGLLAYKPQLAAAVGLVLAMSLGWRAFAGLAASAAAMLAVGETVAPGSTYHFLHTVPAATAVFQSDPTYNWGRQVTPTSFWRTLLGSGAAAAILGAATSAAMLAGLAWMAWRSRGAGVSVRDRLIACTVLALPLAAPYFMDYDLLLLAIPAALLAEGTFQRRMIAGWLMLWLVSFANVNLVRATGVNGVVLVLLTMMGMMAGDWRRQRLAELAVSIIHPLHGPLLEGKGDSGRSSGRVAA